MKDISNVPPLRSVQAVIGKIQCLHARFCELLKSENTNIFLEEYRIAETERGLTHPYRKPLSCMNGAAITTSRMLRYTCKWSPA